MLKYILILLVKLYRLLLTPFIPKCCRFYPSCSTYALDALKKYGLWKSLFLILKRLSKCHPFHPGGYDPVP